ncbi:phosphoribosylanthranilate isomerase [Paenibacillus filicis]|uniref:N-(5'-phosphoribosyl)anthranilate isomerase n=1 Tax=Paenibacillus filicis TaxID=669464 RepID=A0ABU9DEV0_9BACL
MALVKICGLRTTEQAEQVGRLPVDYIGLVFARSKRQVGPAQAGAMIAAIREASPGRTIKVAGVFVNPAMEELATVLAEAPLDVIQLHGQETPAFCREVKARFSDVEVLKAVSLSARTSSAAVGPDGVDSEKLQAEAGPTAEEEVQRERDRREAAVAAQLDPYREAIDGVLLDTVDPVYGGGSGHAFDWNAIPPYSDWCREAGLPLLVAGGLKPDNVGELLREFAPGGVDVSSGVETDGVKDIVKITTFVERVKSIV